MEEIQAAVKEMKRKKCKDKTGWNNEIVLETGEEMLECLLALINKMEEKREVPNDWNEVKVKTIGKKGFVLLMDNKRGLFIRVSQNAFNLPDSLAGLDPGSF